jgi:hypothetical protein
MYSITRALLQSETQAFDDRISEPYGVREPGGISLTWCHSNRVQATIRSPRLAPTFSIGSNLQQP